MPTRVVTVAEYVVPDLTGRDGASVRVVPDTQVTRLRDGRDLAWVEVGDPDGTPVLAFHGTPGSRLQLSFDAAAPTASGVRLIVPDRPGYGLSTYHRGRRLVDWADDVAQLTTHLDVDRFAVVGVSGGGPHALACGALLPDRVRAVGVVAGIGAVHEPGSEAEMMPANRLFTRAARRASWSLTPLFGALTAAGRRWPDRFLERMAAQLPASDAEVLQAPDVRAAFVEDLVRPSPTTGRATAQDFALFARDWGFRLEDITVPVHFWQGDADRNVPPAHAERQAAAVPGAVLHRCPGEGH
ncbi:MAG: alpha/beta fold hydrolase, partial [Mycobacteriales bacterium]